MQPPELADDRRTRKIQEITRAVLFDPRLGSDAKSVRKALSRRSQENSDPALTARGHGTGIPRLAACCPADLRCTRRSVLSSRTNI